jgi:S1-C subfamily serine protease
MKPMTDSRLIFDLSEALADAVERAAASTLMVSARRGLPASGLAWSADLILTTNHALERDDSIQVFLPDGEEMQARLIGRDPTSDLALVRLDRAAALPYQGAEGQARVGQLVLAVGRPTPEGIQASQGIVSSVGGALRMRGDRVLESYLTTDAIPYPGFSGGPLVDLEGRVLGINSSGFSANASLTIPITLASRVVESIRQYGRVRRGFLGVRTQPVELPEHLQRLLGRSQVGGLMLVGVESGSPAEQAHLLIGDILVGVEGEPIENHEILLQRLGGGSVGQVLQAQIIRAGEIKVVSVTVGESRS